MCVVQSHGGEWWHQLEIHPRRCGPATGTRSHARPCGPSRRTAQSITLIMACPIKNGRERTPPTIMPVAFSVVLTISPATLTVNLIGVPRGPRIPSMTSPAPQRIVATPSPATPTTPSTTPPAAKTHDGLERTRDAHHQRVDDVLQR